MNCRPCPKPKTSPMPELAQGRRPGRRTRRGGDRRVGRGKIGHRGGRCRAWRHLLMRSLGLLGRADSTAGASSQPGISSLARNDARLPWANPGGEGGLPGAPQFTELDLHEMPVKTAFPYAPSGRGPWKGRWVGRCVASDVHARVPSWPASSRSRRASMPARSAATPRRNGWASAPPATAGTHSTRRSSRRHGVRRADRRAPGRRRSRWPCGRWWRARTSGSRPASASSTGCSAGAWCRECWRSSAATRASARARCSSPRSTGWRSSSPAGRCSTSRGRSRCAR